MYTCTAKNKYWSHITETVDFKNSNNSEKPIRSELIDDIDLAVARTDVLFNPGKKQG